MTRQPRNVAASVHARLLNRSRGMIEDFQFLLQRYAAERFLYRLGESMHRETFVLKGAMLFALWGGSIYRATRDLDFTGYGSSQTHAVLTALREVCTLAVPDDGLSFAAGTLRAMPIRDDAEYDGLRVRFQATLGTARIPMQIDIGFGNAIEPPAAEVEYPVLLDSPTPRIRAYPPEAVVAEKLHAVVVLGDRNSRFKDFYDLSVLARQFAFDGERLTCAIAATFKRRRTVIAAVLPTALAPRFYAEGARAEQWRAYLTRNTLPGAPGDFAAVGETILTFFGPAWEALAQGRPFSEAWSPTNGAWGVSLEAIEADRSEREAGAPEVAYFVPVMPPHVRAATTAADQGQEPDRGVDARRYRPYPAYKDSGVEWLGEIPKGWEVKRLKHLATLNPEALPEDTNPMLEMIYVDIGGVDSLGHIVEREQLTFATSPSRARRVVRNGDVIVSTVRTYLRAIAPIKEPEPGMVVSTGFGVVRPADDLTSDYASYALRSPYFVERVVANSKGVSFPAINESEMATYELAKPSEPEQSAIAAFLDRETARIDALVAKKERLIALLQEQRTALITRAVTKGLDPIVPMKDSGVEWLGEIPAGWEVKRADALFRYEKIQVDPSSISDEVVFHYSIPSVQDTGDGVLESPSEIGSAKLKILEQRLLVSRLNPRKGVVLIASEKDVLTLCSTEFVPFEARCVDIRWALFVFLADSTRQRISSVVRSATRSHQRAEVSEVAKIWLGVPSRREQRAIAAFLDRETARIDALVARVRDAIDRLKELRTAIISAAVTGKIDVREEVA